MITLNEEAAVGKVIDEIRAALGTADAEILVVDSSSDRTPAIAEEKGARVVRQFPPRGYGRAMMRALEEARGDVVVTLDCDDTYPAGRILEIAETVLSGKADLVNASRLEEAPSVHAPAQLFRELAVCDDRPGGAGGQEHRSAFGHARLSPVHADKR